MSDPIEPINPNGGGEHEVGAGRERLVPADAPNFRADVVKAFGGKKSVLIAGGVVLFVVGAVIASNLHSHQVRPDRMQSAPQIADTQGGKPLTPAYQSDVQTVNTQNAKQAMQSGGTSIATPIMPASPPAEPDTTNPSGPSVEFSNTQTALDANTQGQSSPNGVSTTSSTGFTSNANGSANPTQPALNNDRVQAMTNAMKGLLDNNLPGPATVVASYYNVQQLNGGAGTGAGQSSGFSPGVGASAGPAAAEDKNGQTSDQAAAAALVPAAGSILYARMVGELNSDAPGPALATIVAGPLAGARVLGSFQSARAGLVIKFNLMTVPAADGSGTITTPINAMAVSASDLTSGMATSINDHLLTNLGVTFVAGFAQGFGQALSQSGSTTTTTGTGLSVITNPALTLPEELASAGGTAAGAAGGLFQQLYGDRPPTIKLAAGTPFALVFLGATTGVIDAQTPVQSVDNQGQSGNAGSSQRLTPTLPARSNFGAQAVFGANQ